MKAKPIVKSLLSKANFTLGRNPKVWKRPDAAQYLPEGKRAVLTITADFELAWAPRYDSSVEDAHQHALTLARRERGNVPGILELCDTCNIPITWATVGHLFLDSCAPKGERRHPEIEAVPVYEGPHWSFSGQDWFEFDPCSDLKQAPEWYAPDLIRAIRAATSGHEIGCHTFSHIDCREEACPAPLFESEIRACLSLAADQGLELRSFVHPGLTVGHLGTLERMGFTSFQSDPGNVLGFPNRRTGRLWELYRTAELEFREEWGSAYHAHRFKKIVDRAMASGTVCNFWFHPSFSERVVEEVLPSLFRYLDRHRKDIWITTVGAYTEFLNERHGEDSHRTG